MATITAATSIITIRATFPETRPKATRHNPSKRIPEELDCQIHMTQGTMVKEGRTIYFLIY